MRHNRRVRRCRELLAFAILLLAAACGMPARGAGVTLVTHGFNGNVTDWVIPMVNALAAHSRLPGSNSTCYEVSFTTNGQGALIAVAQRIGGVAPTASDSGEIFIKLNWSAYSTNGYSTTQIATWLTPALLDTNFIQLNVCDSLVASNRFDGDSAALGSVEREKQGRERVVSPPLGWLLSKVARDWMDSSLTTGAVSVKASQCRRNNAAAFRRLQTALARPTVR